MSRPISELMSKGLAVALIASSCFSATAQERQITSENAQTELASAARRALEIANNDLAARGAAAPDAAFVRLLNTTLKQLSPSNAERFNFAGDDDLLESPVYAASVRATVRSMAEATGAGELSVDFEPFIVEGSPLPQASDVVAISRSKTSLADGFCSGVKIASNKVLTAAHCVCMGNTGFVRVGANVAAIGGYEIYKVASRHLWNNQKFCPTKRPDESENEHALAIQSSVSGRDLAILTTDRPIRSAKIRHVLSRTSFNLWKNSGTGSFVRAVGFGYTGPSSESSQSQAGVRLFADIAVASYDCADTYSLRFPCVRTSEMVAAGHPARRQMSPATCSGDSGGPIFAQYSKRGREGFFLVGITSRGISSSCASGGIFALTSAGDTVDWLRSFGAKIEE